MTHLRASEDDGGDLERDTGGKRERERENKESRGAAEGGRVPEGQRFIHSPGRPKTVKPGGPLSKQGGLTKGLRQAKFCVRLILESRPLITKSNSLLS